LSGYVTPITQLFKLEDIISIENENNELEYYLKKITSKTKELVIIPFNPIVIEIFKKYEDNPNRLPKTISNQKFNEYIKEAVEPLVLLRRVNCQQILEKNFVIVLDHILPGDRLQRTFTSRVIRQLIL
jgi:hypothetical protein